MRPQFRVNFDDLRPRERSEARVRWYEAYRGFGRADELVDDLARYLRQHDQADIVCSIRVERRPGREFYFFLSLETEHLGYVPPETREVLEACPHLRSRVSDEPLELDDIRKFASGDLKTSALGQSLEYRELAVEQAPDPFSPDAPEEALDTDDRAEQLLWYLSSLGSGRWHTFSTATTRIGFSHPRSASQLARAFRLLGHMETTGDGQQWSITPSTTVHTSNPADAPMTYVVGYRRANAEGTRTHQRRAPDRLSDPPSGAAPSRPVDNPAEALARLLPNVDAFMAALPQVGGVSHTAQQFARLDQAECRSEPFREKPGLYEITSASGRQTTLLYDGTAWRQGDWYGLRFLAHQQAGMLVPAKYDSATWTLAIPDDQRPPELYERALVLGSGLVPRRHNSWWRYSNVAPDVATAVATRLGLSIEVKG